MASEVATVEQVKVEPKKIEVGSTVRYGEGWYKVKSLWKKGTLANLCGVWDGTIRHKQVPVTEMYEDGEAFYEDWSKSETYKCM